MAPTEGFRLSVDVSRLQGDIKRLRNALGPEKAEEALRHTLRDMGRKIKTIVSGELPNEYEIKKSKVMQAMQAPKISTSIGNIELKLPMAASRGPIGNAGGATYRALKIGPRAKVVKGSASPLPTSGPRVHVYMDEGSLARRVMVRLNSADGNQRYYRNSGGLNWYNQRSGGGELRYKRDRTHNGQLIGKEGEVRVRARKYKLRTAVGISVVQMPMNRSAHEIQEEILDFGAKRLAHYQDIYLRGILGGGK